MRIINGFICVLLLAFAAVQYNDPDAYFWIPIYLIPAAIAGVASVRPLVLSNKPGLFMLLVLTAAAGLGAWWLWPVERDFWRQDVWWQSESAREGMGMMIVTVAIAVILVSVLLRMRRKRGASLE